MAQIPLPPGTPQPAEPPRSPAKSGFVGTFGVAGAIAAICVGLPLIGCAILAASSLFGGH